MEDLLILSGSTWEKISGLSRMPLVERGNMSQKVRSRLRSCVSIQENSTILPLSPLNNCLITTGQDGVVRLWDYGTQK